MLFRSQYPQIETEEYTSVSTGEEVYIPATMSRTILTDILRRDMGFDGVIVSDALDMAAIADNFSVEDTVKMTIRAGVDMLILPSVKNTDLFRLTETYVETAVRLVEDGEIDEGRINESVLRILRLKAKYGLLWETDFDVTDEQIAAEVERACRKCKGPGFIPCLTAGMNVSAFPGVYDKVNAEIDRMSKELF